MANQRPRHWDERPDRDRDEGEGYISGHREDRSSGAMRRNLDRDYGRGDDRFYPRGYGDAPRGYGFDEGERSPAFVHRRDDDREREAEEAARYGDYEGRGYGRPERTGYGQGYGRADHEARPQPHPRTGGHRGKGPRNYVPSDERIQERVCELLAESDEIDASNLEVHVKGGEVTLSGTALDRHQRRLIEDLVEGVFGVRDVHVSIKLHADRDRGARA